MHLKISLDLTALNNASFSSSFYFEFENVSNIENWYDPEEDVTALEFYNGSTSKIIYVFLNGGTTPSYDQTDDLYELADVRDQPIIFECDIPQSQYDRLYEFYKLGIIDIIPSANKTVVLAFRLKSDRDHVNKDLKLVTIIEGSFKAPLGIKSFELDVISYDIDNSYNYVYIPRLKRYYYVSTPQLVTNSYTKLILQEDVLTSWKTLILQQNAFVTRYGASTRVLLYDNRYPVIDETNETYITPTTTTGASVVSFKLVMDALPGSVERAPNVFMKATCDMLTLTDTSQDISAPTGTGLPNIQSKRHAQEREYLMNINTLGQVVRACINNNAPASFIHSALLLPFDLRDIFTDETSGNYIYVGDKVLGSGNEWKAMNETTGAPTCFMTKQGGSPYIKVADFYFNSTGGITLNSNFLDYSPNTQWEIYLPFVGWQVLNPVSVIGKRIQVYYTFDFDTGLSTCFVYNYTNQKVVWSGSCQIGMKMTLATTNSNELTIQKNATTLNLITGLMTGAISTIVGAKTGHASQVSGGLTGMVGTVTGAVNSYNALIERAQITYGTSDNALYSPMSVCIRKTTHAKILTTTAQEDKYKELNGYPYNDYVALSSLTTGNYIEVGDIHFDPKGENIYNVEIDEIVALLKNGVIL